MLTIDIQGADKALVVSGPESELAQIYSLPAIGYVAQDPHDLARGRPAPIFPPSLRIALTLQRRYGAQFSPRGMLWLKNMKIEHRAAKACLEPTGGELDSRLYDLQDVGVQFLQAQERVLLADDMGAGKTVQSLVAIRDEVLSGGNCLILCLKSIAPQWIRHIREWVSEDVPVYDMTKVYKRKERFLDYNSRPGFVVMNWDALPTLKPVLDTAAGKRLRWSGIIGDESHMVQNRDAQRTKVMFQISRQCDSLYLLTGTPQESHPGNLWSQLHCLYPKVFASYWAFYTTFVKYKIDWAGGMEILGAKHVDVLHDVMYPFYLRRTLEEIAPELEEAQYVDFPVQLPAKQKQLYQMIQDETIIELDDGSELEIPNLLSEMTKLRQCLVDVDLVIKQGKSISGKLDALKDLLATLPEDGRAVIFCNFRGGCIEGAKRLKDEGVYYFSDQDDEILARFQRGEGPRFLFTTPDSAGTGGNLQIANVVVFLDLPWRLILYKQACNRIIRIGQKKTPVIYHMHAEGTFDDILIDLIAQKGAVFDEVIIARKILENRRLAK